MDEGGPSFANALNVQVSASGSSTRGADYRLFVSNALVTGNQFTIPAGVSSVTIEMRPTQDSLFENSEWADINLVANAAYALSPQANKVRGVLRDDDGCQPNLDLSALNPPLTANDFQIFQNFYAEASSRADFDFSGSLTANDYQAFLDTYNAGCGESAGGGSGKTLRTAHRR